MKRLLAMLLVLALALSGCGRGDISDTRMVIGESRLFHQWEIESAMETAMEHFRREFDGCTMTEIEYNEDKSESASAEWARRYEADEAIVLYSSFEVGESGGDGSLNPNSTYGNWQWVLTRDDGGEWTLRTWGYG